MNLQERKDKADIISKEAEVVYKKSFLLLASAGGIGGYAIAQSGIFAFFVLCIVINYYLLFSQSNKGVRFLLLI